MKKLLTLPLLLLLLSLPAQAQTNGSNSPYSRYGFGLLADRTTGFNRAMGGAGQALRKGNEVNTLNPASYSAIDSLAFIFDVGLSLQNTNFKQGNLSTNAHNTSVDYAVMGFRLAPRLGMSIGMLPYSTVGYSLTRESRFLQNGQEIVQTDTYQGDGGLHQAYAGVGVQVLHGLSLGANVGYLWGDLNHTITAAFTQATAGSIDSRRRAYTADLRTYAVDLGLQYQLSLHKAGSVTLGATYSLGHNVDRPASYYDQTVQTSQITGDSLTAHNAFQLPHGVSAGLSWQRRGLRLAVDYTWQQWSKVRSPQMDFQRHQYVSRTGDYSDLQRVSAGLEWIPKPDGLHWRDHVRYRIGGSYTTPYYKVDGHDGPRRYQATLGVGLPIINMHSNRTVLNISAGYERVKATTPGMVSEHTLRISLGLSFNERWFMKWKVE